MLNLLARSAIAQATGPTEVAVTVLAYDAGTMAYTVVYKGCVLSPVWSKSNTGYAAGAEVLAPMRHGVVTHLP